MTCSGFILEGNLSEAIMCKKSLMLLFIDKIFCRIEFWLNNKIWLIIVYFLYPSSPRWWYIGITLAVIPSVRLNFITIFTAPNEWIDFYGVWLHTDGVVICCKKFWLFYEINLLYKWGHKARQRVQPRVSARRSSWFMYFTRLWAETNYSKKKIRYWNKMHKYFINSWISGDQLKIWDIYVLRYTNFYIILQQDNKVVCPLLW